MVPANFQEIIHQLRAAQLLNRNLTASLAFLTWDVFITFADEVELIWMTPWGLWGVKTVYVFLRYFSLLSLIITQGLLITLRRKIPVPLPTCHMLYLFQIISAGLVTLAADVIVVIRVYALYNRQRWATVTISTIFFLELVAIAFIIPYSLPKTHFNFVCSITPPTDVNVILCLISLISPVTGFVFILAKKIKAIREGWGNTPIMVLLVRDGTWGMMGLVGVWLVNPLIGPLIGQSLAHVAHFWFMSVVPSIGCRVILNMLRLKTPGNPEAPLTSDVEFDSFQMTSLKTRETNGRDVGLASSGVRQSQPENEV